MNYVSDTWRRQWNQLMGETMGALHTSDFPQLLVESLKAIIGFRHAIIFGYPPGRRPVFLHNGLASQCRSGSVTSYIRGTYLLDPFYDACCRRIANGVYRMQDVAPDEFYSAVGAHPGYVSPCVSEEPGVLSEEIGFLAGAEDGYYVVLSLMRDADEPPFSESEMEILREVEPIVCSALVNQFIRRAVPPVASTEALQPKSLDKIIEQFSETGVTLRERQVAKLILCGHSTESIAAQLHLAAPTVKIHRRNLYAKLSVTSQAEFFAMIIDALLEFRR